MATYKLSKKEGVLLGLLSQLKSPVVRTKFVKLVYLVDHLRAEHLGAPLTGFEYHWDHYGPNSIGNEVVNVLESLSEHGMVRQVQRLTPYENYATYYAVTEAARETVLPLTADDWAFIRSVVKRHGNRSRSEVVRASKDTAAVRRASQYRPLQLERNQDIQRRTDALFSDEARVAQIEQALAEEGVGTSLEDIKALYAESA